MIKDLAVLRRMITIVNVINSSNLQRELDTMQSSIFTDVTYITSLLHQTDMELCDNPL